MKALCRAIGFVIAGVLLTAVIGHLRQPRSYTMAATAASRDAACRERWSALLGETLRGDVGARDRILREMPEHCTTRLRA